MPYRKRLYKLHALSALLVMFLHGNFYLGPSCNLNIPEFIKSFTQENITIMLTCVFFNHKIGLALEQIKCSKIKSSPITTASRKPLFQFYE